MTDSESTHLPIRAEPRQPTFEDFVGQERIKARLQLAIEAAKQRGEALGHVLLIGPPGFGKATLLNLIPKTMGVTVKPTNAMAVGNYNDFAGILTNLEEGEVLFVEDLHTLDKNIAEFLVHPMKDFRMDVTIDRGANARSVRLNLPFFTLVGTATRRDRMPASFLSSFHVIEEMDSYSIGDLTEIARRLAVVADIELDEGVPEKVALSARCFALRGSEPLTTPARLRPHQSPFPKNHKRGRNRGV